MTEAWLFKERQDSEWEIMFTEPPTYYYAVQKIAFVTLETWNPSIH